VIVIMPQINVKWGKKKLQVQLDRSKDSTHFKKQLEALSGVPAIRMKISGIGSGLLKDGVSLEKVKLSKRITMMGTAENMPEKPKQEIVFAEDLTNNEDDFTATIYPPGLKNLGNTCYLNASLQILREVPELSKALAQYKGSSTSTDKRERLTAQMRDLWQQMDKIENGQPYIPYAFVDSIRKAFPRFAQKEDTPMGPAYAQQDADEFLNTLKQTLFTQLEKVDPHLKDIFIGKMKNTFTNQETEEESESFVEDFHKLTCHILKGTKHLSQGIEEGLKGTVERKSKKLGRNSIHTKDMKITQLPKFLTVHEMRFFWKVKEQSNSKILKKIVFPMKMDVVNFCDAELKAKIQKARADNLENEKKEKKDEKTQDSKMDTNEEPSEKMDTTEDKDTVPGLGYYKLVGLVTHTGRSVESGHYMGYTKHSHSKNWLKFDDDTISEILESDVKDLCGGGDRPIAILFLYARCD